MASAIAYAKKCVVPRSDSGSARWTKEGGIQGLELYLPILKDILLVMMESPKENAYHPFFQTFLDGILHLGVVNQKLVKMVKRIFQMWNIPLFIC